MTSRPILYRVAAGLLAIGAAGHTMGGMLGTARNGPRSGPAADAVMAEMRAVHFTWHGADSTWFGWWMGNGLCVSALFLVAIVALWVMGGDDPASHPRTLPIAWALAAGIGLVAALSFRYFAVGIGATFAAIALVIGVASLFSTLASRAQRR